MAEVEALRNLYNKQIGLIDVRELEAGIATARSGGQVSETIIKHAETIMSNAKKKMANEGRSEERKEAGQALTQAVKEASKRNLATLTKLEVATLRAAVEKAEDFFVRAEETVKGLALLNDVEAAQQVHQSAASTCLVCVYSWSGAHLCSFWHTGPQDCGCSVGAGGS